MKLVLFWWGTRLSAWLRNAIQLPSALRTGSLDVADAAVDVVPAARLTRRVIPPIRDQFRDQTMTSSVALVSTWPCTRFGLHEAKTTVLPSSLIVGNELSQAGAWAGTAGREAGAMAPVERL